MIGHKPTGLATALVLALVVSIIASVFAASPPGPRSLAQESSLDSPTPAATSTSAPADATPTLPPQPLPTSTSLVVPSVPVPSATPVATRAVTAVPELTAEAAAGTIIGYSHLQRPIVAHRIGDGPLKIVLVGDIHGEFEANTHVLAEELLAHFQEQPDEVGSGVSLWIIPTMNPDGLATGHRWNARDVDLNRNADTDLDGCAGNDWTMDTVGHEGPHPGAGGAYPFSEPETQAVRDFLRDAWIAVFYHSAAEAIFVDSCGRHVPTARLAASLAESTGYAVPEEGWTGYPVTGDMGDYLAGDGVAAVTVELSNHDDPEFDRNLEGVRALLADAPLILSSEADEVGATTIWLDAGDGGNTGVRSYPPGSFPHPAALEVVGGQVYILDGGRVLVVPLDGAQPPEVLLSAGDEVEGVRVLEILDLVADGDSLLALDRAGDVYHYEPEGSRWSMVRYGRPPGTTSDHYYVALAADGRAHYLLETTHESVWWFAASESGSSDRVGYAWAGLPQRRDVDLAASDGDVYTLSRDLNGPRAQIARYRSGGRDAGFAPNLEVMHPRQLIAAGGSVYALDRAGRRLLELDRESGALLALSQFTDRRTVKAVWAGEATPGGSMRLLLAGRDALYFPGEPGLTVDVVGSREHTELVSYDPRVLEELRGLSMPIEGAHITSRDFQMPGAPRHYRLGVHEGVDFYSHTVGIPVDRDTAVHAVADGVVIRALVDYAPLTAEEAADWDAESRSLGYTPEDVLDGYRGRQIWIDHGDGLVSRYAHLGGISPEIARGVLVQRGQVIGTVGNSGTPSSTTSDTVEVHLHLELWLGGHYIGQFLRPIETREWLERLLR